jgi:hypothetical protein
MGCSSASGQPGLEKPQERRRDTDGDAAMICTMVVPTMTPADWLEKQAINI